MPAEQSSTHNIDQLSLSNQALGLRANELLLKLHNFSALRLFILQLGNLI